MNLTLVTSIFPPEIGGPATYASEIQKRFRAKGQQVKVVALSGKAEVINNVYIAPKRPVKLKFIGFIYNRLALLASILKSSKSCKLIYAMNPAYIGLVSFVAARLTGKPIVLRFVGDAAWESAFGGKKTERNLEDFLKSPEGGINIRVLLTLQKFILRKTDKIIVPSHFLKDILVNYYRIDDRKVKVIYNSIDLPDYQKPPFEAPYSFGKPGLITVGRLVRHKRVDGIIEAVRGIVDEYPQVGLLIVGDGPERGNLEKLSQELGVDGKVRFYGKVTHEQMITLLAEADIFVLNSVYEGLPHAVLEAMACKTPVIATNIRGTDEVVKDGKTGLLVAPDNSEDLKEKLAFLLKDKELGKRLAENAYKSIVENFTWDRNLSLLEKELKEVI